jgi:glycosyltransferase involved in cell wall biosynthesis
MLSRNRSRLTYQTLVNRYIALTDFAAGRLIAGGLPERRVEVKPNFLPNAPDAGRGGGNYAIFVGRLGEEKGLRTLLKAWRSVDGLPLKILGDGPLRAELQQQARSEGLAVEFLGFRPREDVLSMVGRADVQIIPSECYEGFPMVVLEAYACGTPVVASRLGSLDEIVVEGQTGVKFAPGKAEDLARKVDLIRSDRPRLQRMRLNARARFEGHFTADRNFPMLVEIYDRARVDFEQSSGRNR